MGARDTVIYGLLAPNGELRYVGKTVQALGVRLGSHEAQARRRGQKRPCHAWLLSLERLRQRATIIEIERVPAGAEWAAAEQHWIAFFRGHGCRLMNITPGGDVGSLGYRLPEAAIQHLRKLNTGRKMPPEAVEKMAASKRGTRQSEEAKRKISASHLGRTASAAARANMSAAQRGRTVSPEAREKLRQANLGKKASPETRAKLSAARRGIPKPPGHGAKVSAAKRGVQFSVQHRQRLVEAWVRRKARGASHAQD